ncbi:N-acetylaspartylglutamate synthase A isoform X1 [Lutra lutra]|uniref:N-acetylaspartylglutamate synthase A isoform X1 n=1 Tax=Lutra lutra TaxID=9657 RepID=UPI001FD3A2E4|nr:N-acetylaspartylglutamate synthase A isoform X1 [Lutra lutra]
MCSQLWFLTDRRIREDYPQVQILRALRQRCSEQDVRFRAVLMDQIAVTVVGGHLVESLCPAWGWYSGPQDQESPALLTELARRPSRQTFKGLQLNQKALTTFPDVVLVRVPTPSVQSDSDITVLRHLEKLGCRLVNRPQSILNCVNKFWTFQELAGHGVPMPDTFSYGGHEDFSKMIDEAEPLGYPVVVKSTRGHRGKAVFLARDKHHLSDICHLIRHDVPYLFQKYVKESHGKDIRVVVVGGRVIGSMLRCSTDGRMQSNCSLGGVGVMCPLTEQGKQLAVQVSNILGMDFCGIDLLIMDDGSFVVCEANANVGFLAFDQACNLDVGGIIADYTMSLLPNRQTGKMAVLPGLSCPREKKEPDGCASAQGVAESVYAINNGSTSSESEPELGEIRDSSVSTTGAPPPMLPEAGYNINNRIASELKLK